MSAQSQPPQPLVGDASLILSWDTGAVSPDVMVRIHPASRSPQVGLTGALSVGDFCRGKSGRALVVEDCCIAECGHKGECLRLENKGGASDSTAEHRLSKKVSVEASPSALIETCTGPLREDV